MPTGIYPYPRGQDWLQMGNQAIGLQRQIQQSEAFDEDRATTQKGAEYATKMLRDPGYTPDPNSPDYDALADLKARADWRNMDTAVKQAKIRDYKQSYTEFKDKSANMLALLRLADAQGNSVNPELMGQIVDGFVGLNNSEIPNGYYAQKEANGKVNLISQESGKVAHSIDPASIPISKMKEFLMTMSQQDPAAYMSGKELMTQARISKNWEEFDNPNMLGDPNGSTVIYMVNPVNPESGKIDTLYFRSLADARKGINPIDEEEAARYTIPMGRAKEVDVEMLQTGRPEKLEAARTGMTAGQRAEKGLKTRELDIRDRELIEKRKEKTLTGKQHADMRINFGKEWDTRFTREDAMGNITILKGAPDRDEYVNQRMSQYTSDPPTGNEPSTEPPKTPKDWMNQKLGGGAAATDQPADTARPKPSGGIPKMPESGWAEPEMGQENEAQYGDFATRMASPSTPRGQRVIEAPLWKPQYDEKTIRGMKTSDLQKLIKKKDLGAGTFRLIGIELRRRGIK